MSVTVLTATAELAIDAVPVKLAEIIGNEIEFPPFMQYKKTNKIVYITLSKLDYTRGNY